MITDTNKWAWLERLCKLGEIWWLLNSSTSAQRNIRSKTEFESWRLSVYYIDTGLINVDKSRLSFMECISMC